MLVHRLHHAVGVVRPGDGQYRWVGFLYQIGFNPQTSGDYDLSILCQCLADGVQRLLDRGIDWSL